MITIKIANPPSNARATNAHIELTYEPEWFDDPLVKQMIKDIDDSNVVSYLSMENPLFGVHSFRELSAGVKTLIMLLKCPDDDTFPFWLTKCGDNCTTRICKIAKLVNKEAYLSHLMQFKDNDDTSYLRIVGDDTVYKTGKEFNLGLLKMYNKNYDELRKEF